MDFHLSDEQVEIRRVVRKFAANEIAPIAEDVDQNARFPVETFQKMADLGLLGLLVPEEYGGVGLGVLTFCVAMEEIAYACGSTSLSYLAHSVLCAHALSRNGSEEQKRKYLPDMCAAKRFASLAMTEPGAGSDVLSMQTSAQRQGDEYVINGSKTFITNAPIAEIFLVYVKTDKEAGPNGISQIIIERGAPGFAIGQPFHKMGMNGSPTAELFFDNCRVPAGNIVRGENEGLEILWSGLDVERTVGGAMGVGSARAALDRSVAYAAERKQFGKPIASFELIMEKLANMSTDIEAGRLLTYRAAMLCDAGVNCPTEAAQAKLFSSEMSMRAAMEAVQIFGGYGYMREYGVERLFRDAKLGTIGAGTSEIQRMLIARELMKVGR